MVTIFFLIGVLMYVILAFVIVYHLHTYTLNKKLARRTIVFFGIVTVLLIVMQLVLFIRVKNIMSETERDTHVNVNTDTFEVF